MNKDFQNGFALGRASGGVVNEKILDHTVTFTVDGEPYEVVSVKNGNSVNEPSRPKIDGFKFVKWVDVDGNQVTFPFTPSEETIISALLVEGEDYTELINAIYQKMGVTLDDYPYMVIVYDETNKRVHCGVISSSVSSVGEFPQYSYGLVIREPNKHIENIDVSEPTLFNLLNAVIGSENTIYSGPRQFPGTTFYINFDKNLIDTRYIRDVYEFIHFS